MKKLILITLVISLALFTAYGQKGKLEVGKKAPEWKFTDADDKEFTMASWPGKVLQINYVDPDVSDLNDVFNDAVKKARETDNRIKSDKFKGFGIVDCASTWKPDYLIEVIAGNKAKKYETTILFDFDAVLQEIWGLPADNYTVVIIDKNRICRGIYKGKIADSEIENIIKLIIKLGDE
jgi:predicted transcriptional regulator